MNYVKKLFYRNLEGIGFSQLWLRMLISQHLSHVSSPCLIVFSHAVKGSFSSQAAFLYCCLDCPSYLCHLNSIDWATWAVWAATENHSLNTIFSPIESSNMCWRCSNLLIAFWLVPLLGSPVWPQNIGVHRSLLFSFFSVIFGKKRNLVSGNLVSGSGVVVRVSMFVFRFCWCLDTFQTKLLCLSSFYVYWFVVSRLDISISYIYK